MTTRLHLSALAVPLLLAAACTQGQGGESISSNSAPIAGSTIVSRGMEWVNARLHYCQAAYEDVDGDSSCWAWEGSSHRCDRKSDAAWNAYRSDCSGFVTYAWGLPAVGDGGYVTSEFAPYSTSFSHTISGTELRPGDALNKTPDGHIILFKEWVTAGRTATFMEEPGCSSSEPYAHEFTSNVSVSGSLVYVDYEGESFYAIRFEGSSSGGGGGSSSSGGGSSGGSAPDACSEGAGYCTETLQCDGGHWIVRQDDPASCATVVNKEETCNVGPGYCTATLQCESGHWVPRTGDTAACTSGPGG